ncbi:MAG: ATP-binding protein [Bacteroidales bacterium]
MKEFFVKILKRRTTVLWILAFIFAIVSFLGFSSSDSMDREVSHLENRIQSRQKILEKYVQKAMDTPDSSFLAFEEFPEDMVIYRYFDDTLQSWLNQFPIANDDIDFFPFGYTINHLNSVNNTPLAYVNDLEQYMSLGTAWYIVKLYQRGNMRLVAALLVQTDYPTENNLLKSEINPNFELQRQLSIVPVNFDESYVIHGKDGGVLFSVLKNLPNKMGGSSAMLRWFAMLFAIAALFSNLYKNRGVKEFFFVLGGLVIIRFVAIYQSAQLQSELDLFSPNLYADFGLFNSLADLLITNLLLFFLLVALFMIRRSLALIILKANKRKRLILNTVFILIPVLLIPYIHFSLRSLILNSSIVLELYKIDEITFYSILVYVSYGLMFLALLFSLQLLRPIFKKRQKISFLDTRGLIIFISVISLYSLVTVSIYGFNKEFNRNRVLTTKMSIERDLNVELQLRGAEIMIATDPVLQLFVNANGDEEYIKESIYKQLSEFYFWSILQRYDLRITVCKNDQSLNLDNGSAPVHCNNFFEEEIARYGIPLYKNSRFFFMNNYNGKVSYLGLFPYPGFGGDSRLYIELDSKFLKETIGYPEALLSHIQMDNFNIPSSYSYGKYLNNRLVTYGGEFNYPILADDDAKIGYFIVIKDGHIHFTNRISSENMIVISRPERSFFHYFITLSYIMLFYSLLIFGLTRFRRQGFLYQVPKNSFRWKITFLLLSSLIFALLFMGAGSIWFSINYFNENNRAQMEEKMNSVQSTLSDYSKYVPEYKDTRFNNLRLLETMNRLSNNAQIDINVYGSDGLLIRTTQSEIFDRFIQGKRMNPDAYKEIVYNNKKQFVNKEKIAGLSYSSLYAPLYNQNGVLIAIANIPYFSKQSGLRSDASNIIATIINIYLLLLLAAVFGGITLSNSLSKPLAEISKKMELLDISQKPEHIDYHNRDELGILVAAYNKMVDDLEESTKVLAQGEREQAWREMARQIAHEIKNPLTPMRLSIQHLVRLKEQGVKDWPNKFEALANSLIEQIDILSNAAGEFSSFSRFYSEDLSRIELNNLIREQIILFNTRDNITITYESEFRDAYIMARKTQLTRVFVNLLSNAVQAVENQKSGRINITLKLVENSYKISFEDDGTGVPENLTHKLFKPNFTTKSGGTGLGLAICRSIMEQSQGSIRYDVSDRLGGANFTVSLPIKINS